MLLLLSAYVRQLLFNLVARKRRWLAVLLVVVVVVVGAIVRLLSCGQQGSRLAVLTICGRRSCGCNCGQMLLLVGL